jgi:hypothetical protein
MTPAAGEVVINTTNKRPHVGDSSTPGGIPVVNAPDQQNQTFIAGTVGGTGDAITLTNTPAVASYAVNQRFTFKAGATNTTSVTLNVDGLGNKNVKKMSNGALASLAAGDIVSGGMYDVFYDGTQFQIKALAEGPFSAGALKYLGTVTASTSSTLDLTSLLSSTYDDYLIVIDKLALSNNNANLQLRVSTDNGSSFSSSSYEWANTKTTSSVAPDASNGTSIKVTSGVGNTGGRAVSGNIHFHSANANDATQRFTGQLAFYDGTGNFTGYALFATWNGTGPVNALRFLPSAGTLDSGTIKIYGTAKS